MIENCLGANLNPWLAWVYLRTKAGTLVLGFFVFSVLIVEAQCTEWAMESR